MKVRLDGSFVDSDCAGESLEEPGPRVRRIPSDCYVIGSIRKRAGVGTLTAARSNPEGYTWRSREVDQARAEDLLYRVDELHGRDHKVFGRVVDASTHRREGTGVTAFAQIHLDDDDIILTLKDRRVSPIKLCDFCAGLWNFEL